MKVLWLVLAIAALSLMAQQAIVQPGLTPGAPKNSVQVNDGAGRLKGDARFLFDPATGILTVGTLPNLYLATDPDDPTFQFLTLLGRQPVATAGANARMAGGFDLEAGQGADTTIATSGVGGLGGSFTMNAGNGGTATNAVVSNHGGDGGEFDFLSGQGANAATPGSINRGGNGGAFNFAARKGGDASGVGGTNTGGDGADMTFSAAARGVASNGATNTNGRSGNLLFVIQDLADSRFAVRSHNADQFSVDHVGRAKQPVVTDPDIAPGAGYCLFEVQAGTNPGTGKLVMFCGTSTTGTTIVDNVGGGL